MEDLGAVAHGGRHQRVLLRDVDGQLEDAALVGGVGGALGGRGGWGVTVQDASGVLVLLF